MKRLTKTACMLFCFFQAFLLASCTVDMGMLIVPDFYEHDWHCEELNITALPKTLGTLSYATMEYNNQSYTKEYYEELSLILNEESPNPEEYEAFYSALQADIGVDGNFHLTYVEYAIILEDFQQIYTWVIVESVELLYGDVKNKGSYIQVKIEEDNLFQGEYEGKTIYFNEM